MRSHLAFLAELVPNKVVLQRLEPIPNAWLRFVNPAAIGAVSDAPWWPRTLPLCESEARALCERFAVSVVSENAKPDSAEAPSLVNSHAPGGRAFAMEAGRSVVFDNVNITFPQGVRFRHLNVKGVGPIDRFIGENNPLNRWRRHGRTSSFQAYCDLARTNILREAGIATSLGVCICDTDQHYAEEDTRQGVFHYRAATYCRAMTTNTRLFNLRDVPQRPLHAWLHSELEWLSECEGEDLSSLRSYLSWFAERLGVQAARLQRLGYLHGSLHAQQICLDGAICDFEHEPHSGFLAQPENDTCYEDSALRFGSQPERFASLVASPAHSDSLWSILARLDTQLQPVSEVLAIYWDSYNAEFASWDPPDIQPAIEAHGLDNDALLRETFGVLGVETKQPQPLRVTVTCSG